MKLLEGLLIKNKHLESICWIADNKDMTGLETFRKTAIKGPNSRTYRATNTLVFVTPLTTLQIISTLRLVNIMESRESNQSTKKSSSSGCITPLINNGSLVYSPNLLPPNYDIGSRIRA